MYGECPYDDCNYPAAIGVPADVKLPVMQKLTCDNCHRIFWEYTSRVKPTAYREDQIAVDEITKTVSIIDV